MTDHDTLWLWLTSAEGVGPARIADLLTTLRDREMTLEDLYLLNEGQWAEELCLNARVIKGLAAQKQKIGDIVALVEGLREVGVRLITLDRDDYPDSLKTTLARKAPPVLYAMGNVSLLGKKAVAVVGARDASPRGLALARSAGIAFAGAAIVVVSGGARGTDSAAHLGAVKAEGQTIIVLPVGILRFSAAAELGEQIDPQSTLLLSEFPPNMTWQVGGAMARNRIVCALASAVVVTEAGEKGGTVDAAKTALELGRPLFVVEFEQYDAHSAGNAALIRRGAQPLPATYEEAEDAWRVSLTPVIKEVERHSAVEPPAGQMDLF